MRGSGSGSENKIAKREPFWEPDHAANLVQPRMSTETTSAVLSVKADLPDQSERLVEAYGSEGWGFESLRVRECNVARHTGRLEPLIWLWSGRTETYCLVIDGWVEL
jgi:hypothetical protein